jgi:hypothetical protein
VAPTAVAASKVSRRPTALLKCPVLQTRPLETTEIIYTDRYAI